MYAPVTKLSTLLTLAAFSFALVGCDDVKPQEAAGAVKSSRFLKKANKFVRKPARRNSKLGAPLTLKPSEKVVFTGKMPPFSAYDRGGGQRDPKPGDSGADAPSDAPEPTEPQPPPPRKEDGPVAGMTSAHNQVRAQVGVAPMQWDDNLAGVAQQWADSLATDNSCQIAHSQQISPPKGENLYWHSGQGSAAQALEAWAAEADNYTYATNSCDGICGHYTQIVWAETRYLGCGYQNCAGGGTIVVCNYFPAGNYVGEKPY